MTGIATSDRHREEISRRLRPLRPPRVVDDVLGKDQLETVLDLIRRHGPWDLILKHHFRSLEELVATTSGGRPLDPNASLDSFLTPTFRGFFANGVVCLHPEAEPILYDRRFMAWAREFWGAKYCQPMKILFNVNGPARNTDPGHLHSPRFRGMGLVNTPTWLLSVMGKSGLFQAWAIKLAEVIAWFQKDLESGGFTYWPNGPLAAPKRLAPPLWNRGAVTHNTAMFHRGESNGPPAERANPKGLTFDSTFNFNVCYVFGVLAFVVLIIQIVTGIYLTMSYKPSAEDAFASVEYIMRDVKWGWLIRYAHSTGASAFFAVVYLHMFRAMMYGSYKAPRELLWLIGMVIYLALMAEAFFGYLLPWGQMSYWGAQVIVSLFGAAPGIGGDLVEWIRGDYFISDITLNRFFALHVAAVPLALVMLVVHSHHGPAYHRLPEPRRH